LTLLLGAAESAIHRKALIIDAMDATNAQNVINLPFGDESYSSSAEPDSFNRGHYAWLLANLDEANQTLSSAMYHLRSLYQLNFNPVE
jgi:hypothetical protein